LNIKVAYHSAILSLPLCKLVKNFGLFNIHAFNCFEIMPIKEGCHRAICLLPLIKCPPHVTDHRSDRCICLYDMIFEKPFHLDPHFPLVHHLKEALTILTRDLDGFYKHVHLTVVGTDAVLHPVSDGLLIVVLRSHEVNQVVHRSLSFENVLSDRTCLI